MRMRANHLYFSAVLILGSPAGAEQWFAVASPGADAAGTRVEVDLDSIHARGQGGEGVIRVTFDLPQRHGAGFSYRSVIASAQFDCQRRIISLTSAAYYAQPAGKGSRLGSDSSARQAGMPPALLDSIPVAARRALLRASCATTPTSAG
jgi:surface-adhesin protein E